MFGKILGFSTPLFICKKKLSMYACVTKVIPEADLMIHQRSQAVSFFLFIISLLHEYGLRSSN
ncbi:unnamed protein product [Brassica oleracea]